MFTLCICFYSCLTNSQVTWVQRNKRRNRCEGLIPSYRFPPLEGIFESALLTERNALLTERSALWSFFLFGLWRDVRENGSLNCIIGNLPVNMYIFGQILFSCCCTTVEDNIRPDIFDWLVCFRLISAQWFVNGASSCMWQATVASKVNTVTAILGSCHLWCFCSILQMLMYYCS